MPDAPYIPDRAAAVQPRIGPGGQDAGIPVVSVIVANHNGARFIAEALGSAQRQTLREIEIIVADDASTDDSARIVATLAAADGRIRLLRRAVNGGAAAARNTALDAARGRYIAVLDSDDILHPDRLRRLVALAVQTGANIVTDDLLLFDEAGVIPPTSLLGDRACRWIDATQYVHANAMQGGPALGYLKPLICRHMIEAHALRYDATLPIAEDYAFVLDLLLHGARFWLGAELTYFYRRHAGSLSHRLNANALERMLLADDRLRTDTPWPEGFDAARRRRRAGIATALAFETLIAALKQRHLGEALRLTMANPAAALQLRVPVLDRLKRLWWQRSQPHDRAPKTARPSVCLISRQRIIGATNGSSVYLLSLCQTLGAAGFDVHLVCPSPVMFGRWPALWLRPEMSVFRSIRVRGAWQIGRLVIARHPQIATRAVHTLAVRLAGRIGLHLPPPTIRHAVGVDWEKVDFLFVAQHARAHADAILADYAFLTAGIPFALRPASPSAVVMHDLFSSHTAATGPRLPEAMRLGIEAEMALLGAADAIVAIQAREAAVVREHLPARHVIEAPMGVASVAGPQPGCPGMALFVGSNTQPNADGLAWFLTDIWPQVRKAVPQAELRVVGSIAAGVRLRSDGVRFLGQVPDLADLYRQAGAVISPLRFGSGLKIKLVEALAHGKATVATSVTLQGVESLTEGCVLRADDADSFARHLIAALTDESLRLSLGTAALAVAKAHFSIDACTAPLAVFFGAAPARREHLATGDRA